MGNSRRRSIARPAEGSGSGGGLALPDWLARPNIGEASVDGWYIGVASTPISRVRLSHE